MGSTGSGRARQRHVNLAFELVKEAGIFVLYQGAGSPDQADWDRFVQQVRDYDGDMRCLVFTEGWHPSRAQGMQIRNATRGKRPSVAIVSPSTAIPFVVSVFTLVNRRMRFFNADELERAFEHLRFEPKERAIVSEILARLRARGAAPGETRATVTESPSRHASVPPG